MSITLTYLATNLALPDDLRWVDEFTWTAVEQRRQYTVTGALIVEAGTKQAGRAITLAGGDDYGWITRAALATLREWAALPGQVLTLDVHGDERDVVFDQEGGAIEAQQIFEVSDPADTDPYEVTLKFIEV